MRYLQGFSVATYTNIVAISAVCLSCTSRFYDQEMLHPIVIALVLCGSCFTLILEYQFNYTVGIGVRYFRGFGTATYRNTAVISAIVTALVLCGSSCALILEYQYNYSVEIGVRCLQGFCAAT